MDIQKLNNQIKNAEFAVYLFTVLILPLIFLPIFANQLVTPKLVVLVVCSFLILILKALRILLSGSISFSTSVFDLPIVVMVVAYILSTIFVTPNKMEALFLPGTTTVLVLSSLFYFFTTQLSAKQKEIVKNIFLISVSLGSLISFLSIAGIFNSIKGNWSFLADQTFNSFGGSLASMLILIPAFVIAFSHITNGKHNYNFRIFNGIFIAITGLSIIANIFVLLPNQKTSVLLPSFSTSWSVAADTLKFSPLFGAGPANYLTAFTRFKPLDYNSSNMWNLRFANANNFYLTMITETGLLGLTSLILIFVTLIKYTKKHFDATLFAAILVFIGFLFIPSYITTIFILLLLIGLATATTPVAFTLMTKRENASNDVPFSSKLPGMIMCIPIVILSIFAIFRFMNLASAEIIYKQALDKTIANDGKGAYDKMQSAIVANPNVDRYRASYAQINLAIANSLASKKDLNDSEKQTITQLVQQAIREGKAAVSLNPQRAQSWELLASIYRSVIPLAKGADQFAVQTYAQAIVFDQYNPDLRLALGGIFYSQKLYDQAIENYRMAVAAKPDYANANYNLAIAYREKGDNEMAKQYLNQTLSLVSSNSEDYKKVQKDLEEVNSRVDKNKKPATNNNDQNSQTGELTVPEQNDSNPVIELPNEATPPATENQP